MENNNHFAYLLDYKETFGFIKAHFAICVTQSFSSLEGMKPTTHFKMRRAFFKKKK